MTGETDLQVICELLRLHMAANLGIYFDGQDDLSRDLCYCWSNSITDFYWNYGFSLNAGTITQPDIERVVSAAQRHDRQPALWQLAHVSIPVGWSSASEEAWMTVDLDAIGTVAVPPLTVEVELLEKPTSAMVVTFSDAYGGEGAPGDVGYFALPVEYAECFARGRSRAPASSFVVNASIAGESVAVACICLIGEVVGLYSVATAHRWRRRGLGRYISSEALHLARGMGATRAFLQTESDSAVENMYRSIGFSRRFVGRLLAQS